MALINKMQNEYNGVGAITLSNALQLQHGVVATSGSVDGLATGTTTLTTVPAGVNFILTHLLFNPVSFSGLVGSMTLSVGTNAVTYDNIMPSTALTNFNAAGELYIYPINGLSTLAVPTDNITVNIGTAFTSGTTGVFEVIMLGIIE